MIKEIIVEYIKNKEQIIDYELYLIPFMDYGEHLIALLIILSLYIFLIPIGILMVLFGKDGDNGETVVNIGVVTLKSNGIIYKGIVDKMIIMVLYYVNYIKLILT
jgi:hypothetical protein